MSGGTKTDDDAGVSDDRTESADESEPRGETRRAWAHSKLMPLVSPSFSRATRTYGLALAWNF